MLLLDPTAVIDEAVTAILSPKIRERWSYYSGNHPKAWVTPKIREIFAGLADSLTENYCGLAVNSRVSRLEIVGWVGDQAEQAEQIWLSSGLASRQDMTYRWGLAHGVVYLIAGADAVTNEPILAANPATLCYGSPDPEDWGSLAWAAKMWSEVDPNGDGTTEVWYLSIYDDASIFRYTAPKDPKGKAPVRDDFTVGGPLDTAPVEGHGFETIPVLAAYPFGPFAPTLIDEISPVQDRINKIGANKFVAAEFGAFKQRVFFTRQQIDPYDVRQTPDHAIVLDPGDTDAPASVEELGGTDLSNYDEAKNSEVDALFTIASLPRHMRVAQGAPPSGEAIKADEGPFVEALKDNQREFGNAYVRGMALFGYVAGPAWRDVEVHDELGNAQVLRTLTEAGIPWQMAAMQALGWDEEKVLEAEAYKAANTPSTLEAMTADIGT